MAATVTDERPVPGALVQVRGQRWVVSTVDDQQASTLVTLQSVEDGRYGDTLSVIWEVEPGRRTLPSGSLPEVSQGRFDSPERLAAFLDAVRWGAVASADVKTLQAPFRSGVAIEDYQLEPVAGSLDPVPPPARQRRHPGRIPEGRCPVWCAPHFLACFLHAAGQTRASSTSSRADVRRTPVPNLPIEAQRSYGAAHRRLTTLFRAVCELADAGDDTIALGIEGLGGGGLRPDG